MDTSEITISGKCKKELRAVHILSYRNRKLAVVEAKSDEFEVESVAQAKLYAGKLNFQTSFQLMADRYARYVIRLVKRD